MRRCFALFAAALFVPLAISAHSDAAKPEKAEKKVEICHVNSANDVIEFDGIKMVLGRRIEVAESAVAAHYARGDGPINFRITKQFREQLEKDFGVKVRNADCGFFIY